MQSVILLWQNCLSHSGTVSKWVHIVKLFAPSARGITIVFLALPLFKNSSFETYSVKTLAYFFVDMMHTILMVIFQVNWVSQLPLNSPSPFIPELCIPLRQTFYVVLNTFLPGLLQACPCLIPSTSKVIQYLTQSVSSFRSTCPNMFQPTLDWLVQNLPAVWFLQFNFLSSVQFNLTHPCSHIHFCLIHHALLSLTRCHTRSIP